MPLSTLAYARQATMIAMLDVFALIVWSFVVMLPLLLLLKLQQAGR